MDCKELKEALDENICSYSICLRYINGVKDIFDFTLYKSVTTREEYTFHNLISCLRDLDVGTYSLVSDITTGVYVSQETWHYVRNLLQRIIYLDGYPIKRVLTVSVEKQIDGMFIRRFADINHRIVEQKINLDVPGHYETQTLREIAFVVLIAMTLKL